MATHCQGWEAMMNGALAREAAETAVKRQRDPDVVEWLGPLTVRELYKVCYGELRANRTEMLMIPPGVGNCGYGGYK